MEVHRPIKLEVIDLDDYTSAEEKVNRWHLKIRSKIKSSYGDENEETLDDLMKWYIETLHEDMFEIEVCDLFIKNMDKHIQFFHGYFKILKWTSIDSYLDNMETILALYIDLECNLFIKDPKKYKKIVRKNILKILQIYLLYQEDRMYHVLMKIKLDLSSDETKQFLDNILRVMLSREPTDTSDLAFCRAYILHQRWKKVQNPDTYKGIDEMLYKNYSHTPDDLNTNAVLKEVLQPQNNSVLDVLAHIMDNDKVLCGSYFRYIKLQRLQEDLDAINVNDVKMDNSDSLSHASQTERITIDGGDQGENILDDQTSNAVKTEDSDDDCLIIGEGTLECSSEETEIVHEILDDDDDIASIIYFTAKDTTPIKSIPVKDKPEEISFLNSIDLVETDSNKETRNSETKPVLIPLSPTSSKLQDLDNDSVKSREISSRKFTRKKDDLHCEEIDRIDATVTVGNTTDLEINSWDETKSTDATPSHISEGLVTPPTSHDDQQSYERDFNNLDLHVDDVQTCFTDDNIFDSSEMCNSSINLSVSVSNESYVPHNSPDISSTCEPNSLECDEEQVDEEQDDEEQGVEEQAMADEENLESFQNSSIELTKETVKDVSRLNGNLMEHNNNKENKKNAAEKQLKVNVPRINVESKSPENKVLFTSKQGLKNLVDEFHSRYTELRGEHGFEDCLNGALEKISYEGNVTKFDLFENHISSEDNFNGLTPAQNIVQSVTSPSSIGSPEYEEVMDDFQNYLTNYQDGNISKLATIPRKSHSSEKAPIVGFAENPESEQKINNTKTRLVVASKDRVLKLRKKKKGIAFAKDVIIGFEKSHEPIIHHNNRLQGILKKRNVSTRLRIPTSKMNLVSLKYYGMKPNDEKLQSDPDVVIERLRENHEISETPRKTKPFTSSSLSSMTMLRVDYDKKTSGISPYDKVLYRVPESMSWRTNKQPKVDTLDEGTVNLNSEEYYHNIPINTNFSIDFSSPVLRNEQDNVKLCPIPSSPVNPFPHETNKAATEDNESMDKSFIDLNAVNKIIENFDIESATAFDILSQPAAVPEVEEFEKTMQMEEVTKVSTIPLDLHNLNLRKFSPSPVMNFFSFQSPTYSYFSDCSNFVEANSALQTQDLEGNLILDSQVICNVEKEGPNTSILENMIPTAWNKEEPIQDCENLMKKKDEDFEKSSKEAQNWVKSTEEKPDEHNLLLYNLVISTVEKKEEPSSEGFEKAGNESKNWAKIAVEEHHNIPVDNKVIFTVEKKEEPGIKNFENSTYETKSCVKTAQLNEYNFPIVSQAMSTVDKKEESFETFTNEQKNWINCIHHLPLDNQVINSEGNKEDINSEEFEKGQNNWIQPTEELSTVPGTAYSNENITTVEEDEDEKEIFNRFKNLQLENDDDTIEKEPEVRLPLKKRKRSVSTITGNAKQEVAKIKEVEGEEEVIGPEVMEEILKRARAEKIEKEEISYPAKPAISIAEIQEKLESQPRTFKTPAQKKEMPPPPVPESRPRQKIVTEQYNNHTYNNPTINYHMNNVPYSFFPCTNLTYFPPILLPMSTTTTFDMNVMNPNQPAVPQQVPSAQEHVEKAKKEKRSKKRKKEFSS